MSSETIAVNELKQALERVGQRSTRQREQIYALIRDNKNHPTADDIYAEAKKTMPNLSLATVYNCLETFVDCGLVRVVDVGRPAVRYEPAGKEHAHFYCHDCGEVFDINIEPEVMDKLKSIIPSGFRLDSIHLRFNGEAECESPEHCHELADEQKFKKTSAASTRQSSGSPISR